MFNQSGIKIILQFFNKTAKVLNSQVFGKYDTQYMYGFGLWAKMPLHIVTNVAVKIETVGIYKGRISGN